MPVQKNSSNYFRAARVLRGYQAITPYTLNGEYKMFRKITFAALAALALTAAAVAPASAGHGGGHGGGHGMHGGGHWGGHWGGGFRHSRFIGFNSYVGVSCYKTIFTDLGPRRINVCGEVY
jgi:hypothetical protein